MNKYLYIPIFALMLLVSTLAALSQIEVSVDPFILNKSCEWIDYGVDTKTAVYEDKEEYYSKNDSTSYWKEFVRYDIGHVTDYQLVCKPFLRIDKVDIDFRLQGYECKPDHDTIVCDSKSDGNGDGVCNPNGGETCCKAEGETITCKNSVKEWSDTPLPVARLK